MKATPSLLSGAAQFCFKCMENAWKQLNFVLNAWKKNLRILMEFQSKNREPVTYYEMEIFNKYFEIYF
jgi:hypothetical protein